jgi:cysteine desulfurase
MYANNEIGTVQQLSHVAQIIKKIRKDRSNNLPLIFHTDACQAPAYLDVHVSRLGVDLMTINSGKIYGPKQFGCLYVNHTTAIKSQIEGGGQEFNIRSGTESPANIVGFSKALNLVDKARSKEIKRVRGLQNLFFSEIIKKIPNVIINGSLKKRLPNNVHLTFPGQDNELMLMKLDELGVQCASGSACSASSDEVSPTLMAIGLSENEAKSSLRFSMGNSTKRQDIIYTIQKLAEILQ